MATKRLRTSGKTRAKKSKYTRAKRMQAEQRKAMIVDCASVFFALNGFSASTRDLADLIGIRQALLFRYFPSKSAILQHVIAHQFDQTWHASWSESTIDKLPAERAADFFTAQGNDPLRLRLFLHAALEGSYFPAETIRTAGLETLLETNFAIGAGPETRLSRTSK